MKRRVWIGDLGKETKRGGCKGGERRMGALKRRRLCRVVLPRVPYGTAHSGSAGMVKWGSLWGLVLEWVGFCIG